MLDINFLQLGIALSDGTMHAIIKKDTTIPSRFRQLFKAVEDYQNTVVIDVYQG